MKKSKRGPDEVKLIGVVSRFTLKPLQHQDTPSQQSVFLVCSAPSLFFDLTDFLFLLDVFNFEKKIDGCEAKTIDEVKRAHTDSIYMGFCRCSVFEWT